MASGAHSWTHTVQPVQVTGSMTTLRLPSWVSSVQTIDGHPRAMQAWHAVHASVMTWKGRSLIFTGASTQGRFVITTDGPTLATACCFRQLGRW